ncbi:melatonin receptor type 1B-like [Diadema antillarum]|uniref:melatonin receptor type 1B-like n=1 Tax=Diadema antillarum TaxID=105358 RepID=UPI003A881211
MTGNLLIIVVIFRRRNANHFTDTLMGALAVADFVTSVLALPFPIAIRVPPTWLGELYCRVMFPSLLFWISVSASFYTLTAISVERYFAIVYPIKFSQLLEKGHVILAVCFIWVFALFEATFVFGSFYVEPTYYYCEVISKTVLSEFLAWVVILLSHFVLPIMIMAFTQGFSARALSRRHMHFDNEDKRDVGLSAARSRLLSAQKRVLTLIFVVNLTFVVCWTPDAVIYLFSSIGKVDSILDADSVNVNVIILS